METKKIHTHRFIIIIILLLLKFGSSSCSLIYNCFDHGLRYGVIGFLVLRKQLAAVLWIALLQGKIHGLQVFHSADAGEVLLQQPVGVSVFKFNGDNEPFHIDFRVFRRSSERKCLIQFFYFFY
jgi:hypothetical protein